MRTGFMGFFAVLSMLLIALAGCSITGSSVFDDALNDMGQIDSRYGISLHDYDTGVVYIRYNPRYPDPLNADEIGNVTSEFAELASGFREGTPERLLAEARIELLESEKSYKLATKTKKGITSDGFRCDHLVFVEEATANFNESVIHGRSAADKLMIMADQYPDEAEKINITKFWVKFLNSTYDFIDRDAAKNLKNILDMCEE